MISYFVFNLKTREQTSEMERTASSIRIEKQFPWRNQPLCLNESRLFLLYSVHNFKTDLIFTFCNKLILNRIV